MDPSTSGKTVNGFPVVEEGDHQVWHPPHGGKLRVGNPGHDGAGTGRRTNEVRKAVLEAFEARLNDLREIAENAPDEAGKRPYKPAEQLRALDLLGRFAGMNRVTVETEGETHIKQYIGFDPDAI